MLAVFFTTDIGMSLDFPFWSPDIISSISTELQSLRKILLGLVDGKNCVNVGMLAMSTLPMMSVCVCACSFVMRWM
jgi:hypothetical protein